MDASRDSRDEPRGEHAAAQAPGPGDPMSGSEVVDRSDDSVEVDQALHPSAETRHLEDLLHFIRDARGFDFTGYKRSTLERRVRKRMHELGMNSWADYRDRLEIDADEFRNLFNTILINVTSFFRDTEAWNYLRREIVPEVVALAEGEPEIRVWSAGCSSGEEAYSLAIVFAEALGVDETVARLKIYGTDVDEDALHAARVGTYTAKTLEAMSPDVRDRYFDRNGGGYSFRADLRRRVIFGRHDLSRDAPISRLDLLVCRNTLMYFNVEAQQQIIDRLHFGLKDGAYLFLGKAEMLLADGDRFEVTNMRQRIFRRRPGRVTPLVQPIHQRLEAGAAGEPPALSRRRQMRESIIDATPFATIGLDLDGIIVVANLEARSQFGLTASDIGRPFRDHELSYRPVELRSVIEQAQHERRPIKLTAVERRSGNAEPQFFDVLVQPLRDVDGLPMGTSVTFLDTTVSTRLQQEIKRVREDLETAYEELQSTNEELETTNEELQSSIEELETTNEELQSTNEELETTNEELQSGNEELETMNEEMRIRGDELDQTRTFLEGILSSVAAGLIVLDQHLQVQGWNRGAEEMWGLRAEEVLGEAFFNLDFGLPTADLRGIVQDCLRDRQRTGPVQVASVNRIGRSMTCTVSCSPLESKSGGVVLMLEESPKS